MSYDAAKRLLDVLLAGAGLAVFSLPLICLALLLRFSMGSPVLFRQPRVGRGGRIFLLYKFRTMRDTHGQDGSPLPDAARLTPLGRFLRRTSLDELPELWNVLRGDMSLVGPRPLLVEYLPFYTVEQGRRHGVRPGITGWAQINGRNAVDWDARFRLDLDYIERRGLGLDLRILILTMLRVVEGRGVESGPDIPMPRFDDEVKAGRAIGKGRPVENEDGRERK
ncbi:MAG: sugar transferase [Parvibaculum sp.]|uniref:sugar transferase n=1 Tax=Parvibaculum sp. TaxID=2024848 RepID=UPI0025DE0D62|nr:sugar transferase [Parvibaculum sp.]MCE9649658.1 sugar transferase [Parvibaculum sp.]